VLDTLEAVQEVVIDFSKDGYIDSSGRVPGVALEENPRQGGTSGSAALNDLQTLSS